MTEGQQTNQPLRLQHPDLQEMYDNLRRQLEQLRAALDADAASASPRIPATERAALEAAYATLSSGLNPAFTALDTQVMGQPVEQRANMIAQLRVRAYEPLLEQIRSLRATVDPSVQGQIDGAQAARDFSAWVNNTFTNIRSMFSGSTTPPATPAPSTASPPAPPSTQPDGLTNFFNNLDLGDGIGAVAGGAIGWLLGSLFGPGSWLSTIVSVLFAIGGAWIGGTQWGDTINGWLGRGDRPRRNTDPRAPEGRARTREPEGRDMTDEDVRAMHEAYERYRAEQDRDNPERYSRDDDDGRSYEASMPSRVRVPGNGTWRFRPY